MSYAASYQRAKAIYDAHHHEAMHKVEAIFREYARQKQPVSTGRAVGWYGMFVERFSIRGKNLRIHASGAGRYGYVHNSLVVVPASWLDIHPEALKLLVGTRIAEESADIARRIQRQQDQAHATKVTREKQRLLDLMAKYPDVVKEAI